MRLGITARKENCPFFASFEAHPDLAERAEEILASDPGR
jgi:hypothetical protein